MDTPESGRKESNTHLPGHGDDSDAAPRLLVLGDDEGLVQAERQPAEVMANAKAEARRLLAQARDEARATLDAVSHQAREVQAAANTVREEAEAAATQALAQAALVLRDAQNAHDTLRVRVAKLQRTEAELRDSVEHLANEGASLAEAVLDATRRGRSLLDGHRAEAGTVGIATGTPAGSAAENGCRPGPASSRTPAFQELNGLSEVARPRRGMLAKARWRTYRR